MNSIENGCKILLAELANVVTNYQLQASEATRHNLVCILLQTLADRNYDNTPSFCIELLALSLNYPFNALKHRYFVLNVLRFQLFS